MTIRRTERTGDAPGVKLARQLWKACTQPRRAWQHVNRWRLLARHAQVPLADVLRYRRELRADLRFQARLARHGGEVPYVTCGPELYILARATRPSVLVETGVASGVSSAYLLRALDVNGSGTLHSIDLPNVQKGSELPDGRDPGWFVPPWLTSRWRLTLGDTRTLLPAILSGLGRVDFFFHDSDHTYDAMRFELALAVAHLPAGALLLSDDTHLHTAWDEVCTTNWLSAGRVGRVGVTRIPRNP